MFEKELEEKYPFLAEYFAQGIKNPNRAISHSILFYGNDIEAQYKLATEIARILNCQEYQNENCKCLNCHWIREKQHPAVLTVSKLDNKPSDDESKTVISIAQARMIKNSLLNTSDYHRVFIFCDAKIEKDSDGNEHWIPLGLSEANFQEETANSLLKIIEEPPEKTTFFFLTRDKNDLIGTIISRSQSFFVPSFNSDERTFPEIEKCLEDYPNLERNKAFDLAQKIFLLTKEYDCEKILDKIENYFLALLKSNIEDQQLKLKILSDLKIIENAKKQIAARVIPQNAIEDMCLNLTI